MTDQEIINGLLKRDNRVTQQFFYVKSRPLLTSIMRLVFNYPVKYEEMVSELYEYLMESDGQKLRNFQYRSSVYQWLKVVATRFFIQKRDSLIGNESKEPLYNKHDGESTSNPVQDIEDRIDVERLLYLLDNQRYADVLRHLVLEDEAPEKYAKSIGVTVENLYNIKRRAIAALSSIAIKYYSYGR